MMAFMPDDFTEQLLLFVAGVLPEPLIYRPSVNPVRPCGTMSFDQFKGDPPLDHRRR
jgi:hypothetical protein